MKAKKRGKVLTILLTDSWTKSMIHLSTRRNEMNNSNDNLFNLPPLMPESGFGFDLSPLYSSDTPKSAEDLNAIHDKSLQQKIVIDSIANKTQYGMRQLLQTDHFAAFVFNENTHAIMKINQDAQGSSYEAYFSAFNDRLVKTSARHIFGLIEVAAASIAKEVMRSPKPVPQPQLSFMQRLLK
jgi:hypothetical protein